MSETNELPAVAKVYLGLLGEVSPTKVMWQRGGQGIRASALLADTEGTQALLVPYAQALHRRMLDLILREAPRTLRFAKPVLDVSVSPRATMVELFRCFPVDQVVYRTMSHTYPAREMADLLEAGDPEALRYASDALRVARDLMAAEAM